MPANLTPDYLEAERRFKSAKTTEDKVAAMEEMMATIPRHKGTEKIQGDLKRRLSKLRADSVKQMMLLLGAREAQIESVSFGEEKPRAEGHDEAAWSQNRRDDIVYQGE